MKTRDMIVRYRLITTGDEKDWDADEALDTLIGGVHAFMLGDQLSVVCDEISLETVTEPEEFPR